jgi:hypothetical protein
VTAAATSTTEEKFWRPGPWLPDGTYIFVPKIPTLEYFGGPWNVKFWYISRLFGMFCSYLVQVMSIWWSFGVIFSQFGTFYQGKSGNPGLDRLCALAGLRKRQESMTCWKKIAALLTIKEFDTHVHI